jgi:hypothetical protein
MLLFLVKANEREDFVKSIFIVCTRDRIDRAQGGTDLSNEDDCGQPYKETRPAERLQFEGCTCCKNRITHLHNRELHLPLEAVWLLEYNARIPGSKLIEASLFLSCDSYLPLGLESLSTFSDALFGFLNLTRHGKDSSGRRIRSSQRPLTIQTTYKRKRQLFVPAAGFESAIPQTKQPTPTPYAIRLFC